MRVFIVMIQDYYEGGWVAAVFSTESGAERYAEKLRTYSRFTHYKFLDSGSPEDNYPCIYIDETALDEETVW